jgi:hypothetical protein
MTAMKGTAYFVQTVSYARKVLSLVGSTGVNFMHNLWSSQNKLVHFEAATWYHDGNEGYSLFCSDHK